MGIGLGLVVIMCRYSSNLQRPDSIDDQERKVRDRLAVLKIDHTDAVVLRDEAMSGTLTDRPALTELKKLVDQGRVRILAVDEQSRFSRSMMAPALIQDLVYKGVRFISVSENIDTENGNWPILTQLMGLHHNMSVSDTGHRVRRGQEGRVINDGSAGDFGYGYESFFLDPLAAAQFSGRGPKPMKGIRINEREAETVREIFRWFLQGWSIGKITRELNCQQIDKGHRASTAAWHHHIVRRMLSNAKYIGRWAWGWTTTKRSSAGDTKQIPSEGIYRDRPTLRIIDDETWSKTQQRLADLHKVYGQKSHQRPRGQKPHYTDVYPRSLLGGLLYCGACGEKLWSQTGGKETYYGCPNHRKGTCSTIVRVPMHKGEALVLDFVTGHLLKDPAWMDEVMNAFKMKFAELDATLPKDMEEKVRENDKLEREVKNLTEVIAAGGVEISAVIAGLREREGRLKALNEQLQDLEKMRRVPQRIPSTGELCEELKNMASILRADASQAALLLRKILGRITVYEIPIPGKKRGYAQLRFNLDCLGILNEIVLKDGNAAKPVLDGITATTLTQEVILNVSGLTRMDQQAPEIVKMRSEGLTWKEIAEKTGLRPGNAFTALKRYLESKNSTKM